MFERFPVPDPPVIPDRTDLQPWRATALSFRLDVMTDLKNHHWKLSLEMREDDDHCDMVVRLDAGARKLTGEGRSRRNPTDPSVPRVGEELAAARALHDLANHLTEDAWSMIEAFSKANA